MHRVRRRTSRNTHSPSHGMCETSVDTRAILDVGSSMTSYVSDNGASSSRTVSPSRPLHHCSFCGKNGHLVDFCFRRAKHLRRAPASKSPSEHCLSHDMHTKEPSTKTRFVDTFSSGVGQHRGHGLRDFVFVPRAAPRQDFRRFPRGGPRFVHRGTHPRRGCVSSFGALAGSHHGAFMQGHRRFSRDGPRFPHQVVHSRRASKDGVGSSCMDHHLHHANSYNGSTASLGCVSKVWVPKHLLSNPLGSKTWTPCLSHV